MYGCSFRLFCVPEMGFPEQQAKIWYEGGNHLSHLYSDYCPLVLVDNSNTKQSIDDRRFLLWLDT